jgi:DNA polymerase III epsilon subunit-like protein
MGDAVLLSERANNEEAIKLMVDAFMASERPGFGFDLVMDLAQRNRELCDAMAPEGARENRSPNLPRNLSDQDTFRGIATLQHKKVETVAKAAGPNVDRGVLWAGKAMRGTVLGVDIETTSTSPDRGRIINIGWELMDLSIGAEPHDAFTAFCGLPAEYEERGVPLSNIHHISWDMIADAKQFREDEQLQEQLLKLLCTYPFMAHNAAFEDAWFMLNLNGYAEARKQGKVVPIDTREMCRALDPEVRRMSWDQHPATLENWARRRGTLAADADERHLGLDDTDLMLRTVLAELQERELVK